MLIAKTLLDELTEKAKVNPRLRMNYDLRDSSEDESQRMLNAIEPGTVIPIHRHIMTSEDVAILRGKAVCEGKIAARIKSLARGLSHIYFLSYGCLKSIIK